jgi:hypothetical protein
MEKDSGRYCYEPYQSKNSTNSLKRDAKTKKSNESCRCFGKSRKSRTKAFFTGLATNLGICILLFGYTLIGSVIFLAIEGGNTFQHSTTQILATTSMASDNNKKFLNHSAEFKARNDEARARTVENIWDITVSLNILYRDNWTRLAAQEITRFQDELLKSLGEELAQQPVQEKKTAGRVTGENYEWTFAKAFLYSLTVLTTIGEFLVNELAQILICQRSRWSIFLKEIVTCTVRFLSSTRYFCLKFKLHRVVFERIPKEQKIAFYASIFFPK